MSKSIKGFQPPTHDEIAARAHSIYEKEGRPNGRAKQHWLQAEAQLVAERKAQAEQPPVKGPANARADGWNAPARNRPAAVQGVHHN